MQRDCLICGKGFSFCKSRAATAKYCSRECSAKASIKPHNARCSQCGSLVKKKPKELSKVKLGVFCSSECWGKFIKTAYAGDKNPNYNLTGVGKDGYRTHVPAAKSGSKERKLHRETWREVMCIDEIPEATHIHHRDCDVLNNDPMNLVALTTGDHIWLHKQYGNATLWAISHGKLSVSDAISWSDDPSRASRLLTLTSVAQSLAYNNLGLTLEQVLTMRGPIYVEFVEE